MTANSKANFSLASDIIGALQNIISTQFHRSSYAYDNKQFTSARSFTSNHLETQYPISNTYYSAFNLNYQNISAIITKRQQQLDAASHEISRFQTVMDVCGKDYIWAGTGSRQLSAMSHGSSNHEGVHSHWDFSSYKNNWTELWSLLQPYINQVSSLSFDFGHNSLQFEVMISDFLALEELTISLHFNSKACVVQSISQLPCTLCSLMVTGLFFNMEYASTFNPAWACLTNIQIELDEPSAFLQLLRLCPNLSSLTITIDFTAIEAMEPLTHTQFQSLQIVDDDFDDDDSFDD
ncbi:hypothetical protein F4604DRAFT_1677262 [Suillus subluteus]|nr:hypothetical protein F4604DRAFT_1677262 [Suillus subluteus]